MHLLKILLGFTAMSYVWVMLVSFLVSGFTGAPWKQSGSCRKPGVVAFTFDDGVSANYPHLLDVLDRQKVKAGLFIVGDTLYSKTRRGYLARARRDGHLIMNHSWSHPDLTRMSYPELGREITSTQEAIASPFKYIRPPYGRINARVHSYIKRLGYTVVLWNLDLRDWDRARTVDDLRQTYTEAFQDADPMKSSFLILQHDARRESIDLVPDMVQKAKDRGFRVVSFAECFEVMIPGI